MEIVRTCTQCGTQDTSLVWPSLDKAAAAAGGIEFTWACPSCAGPEFELAERSLDDLVAAGAVSGSQPSAPTDPGEVRRAGPSARPVTERSRRSASRARCSWARARNRTSTRWSPSSG